MSYASANQNHENGFDLSETFLKKTGGNLNDSLETKERVLPDRLRANIEEAERVLRALPDAIPYEEIDIHENKLNVLSGHRNVFVELQNVYNFILGKGVHTMQEVLQRNFIIGWDSMNLYDCMSDSFELSQILNNSVNMSDVKPWRAAVQLRLEEKLIASKRASYNLDRVHDAYCNAVPLVNNMVTPNGSYDSLYLTEGLFPKTTEINQTYTRLRRHIKKYIENIDGLFRNYIADGHVVELILNYCNGFLEASIEYDRDMRLYESLVIRKPLQNIIKKEASVIRFFSFVSNDAAIYTKRIEYYEENLETMRDNWHEYDSSQATDTIIAYLESLKNNRHVNKLSLAAFFTSDKITKLVDNYQDSVTRSQENIRKMMTDLDVFGRRTCGVYFITFYGILESWCTKQYDHYNRSSDYEKAAMESYFMPYINSAIYRRIIQRDTNMYDDCLLATRELIPSHNFTTLSLRQLTAFKNMLESFLQKTRLDGTFFRYVSVI